MTIPKIHELEQEVVAYQQRIQTMHNAIARNQQELAAFSQQLVYKQAQLDLLKAQAEEQVNAGNAKQEEAQTQAAEPWACDHANKPGIRIARSGAITSPVGVPDAE